MSPVEIADHLDERFRILTGKRRGRARTTADAARHRRLVVPAARAGRAHRVRPLGDLRRLVRRRGRRRGRERRVDRRVAGARGGREPRGEVDARRRGRALAARPATRCSRRSGCSPATSSTSAMTLIDGAAVTPRTSPTMPSRLRVGIQGADDARWTWRSARRPRQRAGSCRVGARPRRPRRTLRWPSARSSGWRGSPRAIERSRSTTWRCGRSTSWPTAHPSGGPSSSPLASQHELNRGQPERALELSRESLRDGIVTEALYSFLPHQNAIFAELMVGSARARRDAACRG